MVLEATYECMAPEQLHDLQLERLQSTLTRVSRNVPFYRQVFEERGLDPDEFLTMDDVGRLPFTTKSDVRDNYPYGLFAVPLREVVRLQASSGTTGKPVVVGYTRNDVKRWAKMTARLMAAAGVTQDDVVQVAFNYGLFTGGFGFHYAAEALGASVIPASSGGTRKQVAIMQDYRTTVLCCTPSYALYLADVMEDAGINVNSLTLKCGLFGAESWSETVRAEIEQRLKIDAFDTYGLSEVMGPGIAGECEEKNGLHVNEDHFFAEIVDPKTLEPLPEGEVGELVLTTLTKEAFPVLRYRTGDLTRFVPGPCPCGRSFRRIAKIVGRTDDMVIIRGVNVFPSQVEAVLGQEEHASPHYQLILDTKDHLDRAVVEVEADEGLMLDGSIAEQQELIRRLESRLCSEIGVGFSVRLVEPKSLARFEGKASRVVDRRRR